MAEDSEGVVVFGEDPKGASKDILEEVGVVAVEAGVEVAEEAVAEEVIQELAPTHRSNYKALCSVGRVEAPDIGVESARRRAGCHKAASEGHHPEEVSGDEVVAATTEVEATRTVRMQFRRRPRSRRHVCRARTSLSYPQERQSTSIP